MTSVALMPGAAEVRELLAGLLDKPVVVAAQPRPVLPGRDVELVGSYVDDDGALRAVALCDRPLGTALGAALALVPPLKAAEALASGRVPAELADNAREVLNVGASLFNGGQAHLRLQGTWVVPERVPEDVVAFLREPCRRADLAVEVPGYGEGVLALLVRDSPAA